MATRASKGYLCAGSSSFDDPDVVELSPAAAASAAGEWSSGHQKRKRSQVVPHEVIELDADDDSNGFMIIGEKSSVDKNKQAVGYPIDWLKDAKSSLAGEIAGPSTYASNNPDIFFGGLKILQDTPVYNNSDDYTYATLEEDLAAKLDDLEIPTGVEAPLPWLQMQKAATEMPNMNRPVNIVDDKLDEKYDAFKQFDTVDDHSDHYYSKPELRKVQVVKKPSKDWSKRIQHEWKVLEKDLPDNIFVRAYEDRMDLLIAVIMGPAGTPYHDGLFFFDIYFPPHYPSVPPMVNYRSGGLRLNPNLTMLYSLRNPPKHFADFIAGHFRKYGHSILIACRAYLDGAQVGCLVGNGVQDVDEGDKSCSAKFKSSLKILFEELLMEFTVKGADCDKFLAEKAKPGASTATADTTLRL
ncbi:hypothetical protein GUJ93_ZPchr0010g11009 [Zizania palustris]|uniref:UBC core domain-containing protein n=1 Tax=Zizania palustris TaxID=103762 RepID=A0A8J6BJG4_ZIZPA|nr:hypothetical protein GUJ93_ZPchr0010g11009 [Zizania palustris]